MTICKKCNLRKDDVQFGIKKDGRFRSYCKSCQNEYSKAHYRINLQKYQDHRKKVRSSGGIIVQIRELKSTTPCSDCHIIYPYYVMDFDHVGKKTAEVSRLISNGCGKRVLKEIKECELVCANCHRIRTYNRRKSPRSVIE